MGGLTEAEPTEAGTPRLTDCDWAPHQHGCTTTTHVLRRRTATAAATARTDPDRRRRRPDGRCLSVRCPLPLGLRQPSCSSGPCRRTDPHACTVHPQMPRWRDAPRCTPPVFYCTTLTFCSYGWFIVSCGMVGRFGLISSNKQGVVHLQN
jgi:hypothetical protein